MNRIYVVNGNAVVMLVGGYLLGRYVGRVRTQKEITRALKKGLEGIRKEIEKGEKA